MIVIPTHSDLAAREEKIKSMFDHIAPRYDLANRLLSFGQDIRWRKYLSRQIPIQNSLEVLDVATGTADVAIELARTHENILKVYGIDTAPEMLAIGRKKISTIKLDKKISLMNGNAQSIPFPDNRFDVITIAFGIRNITDVPKALKEMHRVSKPGGRIFILEFSLPGLPIIRKAYLFYFRHILPWLAGFITGKRDAYRYLNQTVESFPYGESFMMLVKKVGFDEVHFRPLTFGIATLYQATKRGSS